jgi:LmbE family N-acetylglucosaminyl deacetylase
VTRETPRVHPLLRATTVLAVQPHYDDNDIASGGTLALLADRGVAVHYVTVTDDVAGVLDPDLSDDEARAGLRAEAIEAGRVVGVASHHWLDRPDASPFDHHALRDDLIALIRALRPDIVLTCDPWLPDEGHTDHLRTGHAAVEAAMLAGLPRVCRSTVDPAHGVAHIGLVYTAAPNVVVDTSSVQERRHRALDAYRMQFTAADLDGLHAVIDRHERAQAPVDATHGEALHVAPTSAFHCGLAPRHGHPLAPIRLD